MTFGGHAKTDTCSRLPIEPNIPPSYQSTVIVMQIRLVEGGVCTERYSEPSSAPCREGPTTTTPRIGGSEKVTKSWTLACYLIYLPMALADLVYVTCIDLCCDMNSQPCRSRRHIFVSMDKLMYCMLYILQEEFQRSLSPRRQSKAGNRVFWPTVN